MGNLVKRLTQILGIAVLALGTLPTMAVVVDTTGSYGITRTNFPETVATEIVALDLTGKTLINGTLEVTEVITSDGPNREWVEFIFSTPQGQGGRLPTLLMSCGRSIFLVFQPLRRLPLMA